MRAKILVVEDSKTQAMTLELLLKEHGYTTWVAEDGQKGLEMARSQKPDLIISDIVMPVMNGYDMCHTIKADEAIKEIPVVLLTYLSDPKDIVRGLKAKADYYLTKPYDNDYFMRKISSVIENPTVQFKQTREGLEIFSYGERHLIDSSKQQIISLLLSIYENSIQQNLELSRTQDTVQKLNAELEEKVRIRTTALSSEITERLQAEDGLHKSYKQLRKALHGTIRAAALTVETRDPYTAGHQRRVADLASTIATQMGLPKDQIEGIRMAAIIHDLGKISVPSELLTKPTRLTEIEFRIIKTHSAAGHDILKDIDFPWPLAQIVLQHHEKMDGSGYPGGLSGEDILLEARIMCVADVVEAIASDRPYRAALGFDIARQEIIKNRGLCYDPQVVDACIKIITEQSFAFDAESRADRENRRT